MRNELRFVKRTLQLAEQGLGRNFPNPLVGAVVVARGEVIAEGFYQGPGSMHAEASALAAAGEMARGAELYLNLEPCCHYGMTPPCVDAIISSGISRVVFSHYDPDPRVRGRGAEMLRSRGVKVEVGMLADEAVELNLPYIHNRMSQRVFVVLKLAATLDGRITFKKRKYITGERTRGYVHYIRTWTEAIGIGINTLLIDAPILDRRLYSKDIEPPIRVVFDYYCRFPGDYRWLKEGGRVIVFCHEGVDSSRSEALEEAGARVIPVSGSDGRLELKQCLHALYEEKITSILIEGGASIADSFIMDSLFDRLIITYAPYFGGKGEVTFLQSEHSPDWMNHEGLILKDINRFENDLVAVYDREAISGYVDTLAKGDF